MKLSYDNANQKIAELREAGVDIFWRGYSVVVFKPHNGAMYNSKGVVRNGQFGYENIFDVQSDGTWNIKVK